MRLSSVTWPGNHVSVMKPQYEHWTSKMQNCVLVREHIAVPVVCPTLIPWEKGMEDLHWGTSQTSPSVLTAADFYLL